MGGMREMANSVVIETRAVERMRVRMAIGRGKDGVGDGVRGVSSSSTAGGLGGGISGYSFGRIEMVESRDERESWSVELSIEDRVAWKVGSLPSLDSRGEDGVGVERESSCARS